MGSIFECYAIHHLINSVSRPFNEWWLKGRMTWLTWQYDKQERTRHRSNIRSSKRTYGIKFIHTEGNGTIVPRQKYIRLRLGSDGISCCFLWAVYKEIIARGCCTIKPRLLVNRVTRRKLARIVYWFRVLATSINSCCEIMVHMYNWFEKKTSQRNVLCSLRLFVST